jgi:2,3-bisphosphoglycerate-dependent phosphoglycerate mutase
LPPDKAVYILRHATPDRTLDVSNRARPLNALGKNQAEALVPFLQTLGLSAVYTSPFLRAIETVRPFCKAADLEPILREDLRESGDKEPIDQVTDRMIGAVTSIVGALGDRNVLISTHGGCTWGTIRHFDPAFDYENYKRIRTPDIFRIINDVGELSIDGDFKFAID